MIGFNKYNGNRRKLFGTRYAARGTRKKKFSQIYADERRRGFAEDEPAELAWLADLAKQINLTFNFKNKGK